MSYFSSSKAEKIIFNTINYTLLTVFAVVMLYPFLNTIAVSFNEAVDTIRGGITVIPRKLTMQNYKIVFASGTIYNAFFISVARTAINMVSGVFFTAMIAYVLSRQHFFLRKPFTLILILSMYVNAGLIPNYFLIKNLGMINSFYVYIIPGIVNAFNFVVMRTFMQTIPDSIIESVRIDGGGDFLIFTRIILPLSLPVIATIALFVAVTSWNSWFDTMLYASGKVELHTLQYKLMEYIQSSQASARSSSQAGALAMENTKNMVTPVSIRAAITVIAAAPILFVYPFMQRYFIVGLNVGGVKG